MGCLPGEACGGDAELSGSAQLLEAHRTPTVSWIRRPLWAPSVMIGPWRIPDRQSPVVDVAPTGTVIGPYKLLQPIGEGGMGTVYMAEQTTAGAADGRAEADQGRHGQPPGARAVRGRTPGPGPDGPPQHRQGLRRRHHRYGPTLLRHGAGQGRPDHPVLRRAPADDSASDSSWPSRSARPCSTPIRRGSSTATSSRRTS